MTSYTISDEGGRQVRFNGELLASASTRERGSLRWTETHLYRTNAGSYILQKVGRTLVYHAMNGCKYGQLTVDGIPFNAQPCPVCKPDGIGNAFVSHVKMETDRFTVHVSETAEGIVESGKLMDDQGVWFTPRVTRDVFETAAENDSAIRDAYMTTVVE